MWTVYVLYSPDYNRFYTGMCMDLERRLTEHNSGKTKSTKAYAPWVIFYNETAETRENARIREKYLKSGIGREYIKRLRSSTGYLPAGRQGASESEVRF